MASKFLKHVKSENIPPIWGTILTPKSIALLYIGILVTSFWSIKTFPKSGFNWPIIMLNKVDFPTPLGPSKPQISPSLIEKETSSNICLLLNDKEIFLSDTLCISFLKLLFEIFLL